MKRKNVIDEEERKRLSIDALKKEAITELYDSAQCLEEFCAHMSCDTCVLYSICCHIDNYPEPADCLYHLMYDVKHIIKQYI